ncbi:outer membrane protein assembly factor BamB family protein [Streptomyces sp. PTD5-9]|uniref:outer membrane protein assembly factor BamB family protein n=1 Tax=Streptomyces sp. PTD5-9 TaxID=3120150 RepID=UPI003009E16C
MSRRHTMRLAGKGLGLALLGAGVWGCGPENDNRSGGTAPKPGRKPEGAGGEESFSAPPPGTAPKALWQTAAANDGLAGNDALAVVGDLVIVSGDPLVARDLSTGEEVWSRKGVTTPGAGLLLGSGTLYLASAEYDGNIVGLDPATGKETWRSRLGSQYAQPRPIAVDDDHVYVTGGILDKDFRTPDNVVAAIDTTTGKVVWREQRDHGTEETGITARAVGGRLVYTDFRKNLTVRETATGRQTWTKKIERSNSSDFVVHQDLVVLADGGRLRAFALADGGERWSLASEEFSRFNGPAVLDGVLYVSDSAHGLWAVDPATGKKIWHNTDLLHVAYPWRFAKAGGALYGATEFDEHGGVHAFDAASGKLRWTYNDGTGDIQKWYLVSRGKRLAALHGKKLTALPAV